MTKQILTTAALATFATAAAASAATIAAFDFDGDVASPSFEALNVDVSDVTVTDGNVSFFGGASGDAIATNGFTTAGQGFSFIITPESGFEVDFTEFSFVSRRSDTGPTSSPIVVGGTSFGSVSNGTSFGSTPFTIDITSVDDVTGATTFFIGGSGASGSSGTLRIDNISVTGDVTVIPEPLAAGGLGLLGLVGLRRRRA